MEAVTLSGLEQLLGALVLLAAGFVAVVYGGGFIWYRLISYPLARRGARSLGFVIVGNNIFGDDLLVEWNEADWRAASFKEWRSVKVYEGESTPKLWPTRELDPDEMRA